MSLCTYPPFLRFHTPRLVAPETKQTTWAATHFTYAIQGIINVHVIIFEFLHHRIQSLVNRCFDTFYRVLNDKAGIMCVFKTLSSQLYCRKIRNGTRPLCSFLENTRSIQSADAILTEEGYEAESWGGYKSPSSAAFSPPSTHFPIRLIPPRPSSAASEAVGQTTTPTLEL